MWCNSKQAIFFYVSGNSNVSIIKSTNWKIKVRTLWCCSVGTYLWRFFFIWTRGNIRERNLHNCILKWSLLLDVIVSFELDGVEWADHTYSLTRTETFIALYANKSFQCTVGQRLKKYNRGTFTEQSFAGEQSSKNTLERESTILIPAWIWVCFNFRATSVKTLVLENRHSIFISLLMIYTYISLNLTNCVKIKARSI